MSDGGSEGGRENVDYSADPSDQLKTKQKMYGNFLFYIQSFSFIAELTVEDIIPAM